MKFKTIVEGYIHPSSIGLLAEFGAGLRICNTSYSIEYWSPEWVQEDLKRSRSFSTFRKYKITVEEC